ncbi:hypothetical protein ACFWJT_34590 [Streptomyces sp. NPDC127069]|uniref:hypothetical protein n=1 Tax=Streptomyces sp. NPDC127069 TaxID=3347128 RepID=UPI003654CEEE
MQARQFGYQVSPRNAMSSRGMTRNVDTARRTDARLHEASVVSTAAWVAAVAAVVFLWWVVGPEPWLFLAGGGAFILAAMVSSEAGKARKAFEAGMALLGEHPWQVWPCRLEVTGVTGRHRILLLAPDGSAARSYVARVPESVWYGMTDGIGALWVCGDLRFLVVMAKPGGTPLWIAHPEPASAASTAPADPTLIADLARTAGRAAVEDWFT